MGRIGPFTFKNAISRCVSQLSDYPDVRLARDNPLNCPPAWMWNRHRHKGQTAIPKRWYKSAIPDKASWPPLSSHAGVSPPDETGRTNQSYDFGIWFFNLVSGPAGQAFGNSHRDALQRRPVTQIVAPAWLFGSSPETHTQRQEGRNRLRKGQERPYSLEKKR
jgi:hypothetical protein